MFNQEEESFRLLAGRLDRLLAQALQHRVRDQGVQAGQLPVLLCLWDEDGLTQAELCRRVRVEQPTMANTLSRMVRDGLVAKTKDARDKRKTHIRLTERGRDLQPLLTMSMEEVEEAAFEEFEAEERQALAALMRRAVANLEADLAPPVVLVDVVE